MVFVIRRNGRKQVRVGNGRHSFVFHGRTGPFIVAIDYYHIDPGFSWNEYFILKNILWLKNVFITFATFSSLAAAFSSAFAAFRIPFRRKELPEGVALLLVRDRFVFVHLYRRVRFDWRFFRGALYFAVRVWYPMDLKDIKWDINKNIKYELITLWNKTLFTCDE